MQLIDELLTTGITPEVPKTTPRAGEGAGCVEAPRGILFHRYAFDDKGICTGANISIPTNQNHGNIQKDFEAFVPQIIDKSEDEIRLLLEMLVRSYDPCISCSTHYLTVDFV
jgi:coenzyme F420-reducing hydrogenase alpha subunit